MKLRTKLVLLLAAFCAFMVVSVGSAAWAVALYLDASFAQFERWSSVLREIGVLRSAIAALPSVPRADDDPPTWKPRLAALADRTGRLIESLRAAPLAPGEAEDAALYRRLEEGWTAFQDLARQSDPTSETLARFAAFQTESGHLLTSLESRVSRKVQQASETANRVQLRVLLVLSANAFLAVVAALGGAAIVRHWLTRPISRLAEASERLAEGQLDYRIPVQTRDELGRLAERFNDMAQRLALSQRLLVERERMAAVGEFCSAVTHGLRNPLSGIMSSTESLLARPDLTEEARAHALDILSDGERLSHRVQRLLEFARTRRMDESLLDVTQLLDQAATELRELFARRGAKFVRTTDGAAPLIRGDRELLVNAFIEVLSNALDQPNDPPVVEVRCQPNGREAEITFRDHGPGFTEEQQRRAFDLFYTTKPQGTGIGLAAVRRAAELHQGTVCAGNAPDGGGIIRIRLPLYAERASNVPSGG